MKLKKIIAVVSGVVMLTGGLTACGSSSGAENSGANGEPAAGVTTITVWTGATHNKAFMDQKVNEWNETTGKEKGIKIEYSVKDNIGDMIETAFLSDQAPDMFPLFGGPESIEKFVTEGRVAALEDLPGGQELVDKYEGKLANYKHRYKGKTYILPTGTTTYGLVYNKDMFKAAGLVDENGEAKAPETLAELREYAKVLTNPDKKEYGIVFPGKYGDWFSDDVLKPSSVVTGYLHFDPATGLYDYSGTAAVMETLMGIKEDQSFLPGVEGLDNDPARARFAEGGIGMYFSASYDYGVFTEQFPAKCDWGVAPYPVENTETARKQICGYNRYLSINKASVESKGADKLMEVYNWLHSDEMIMDAYKGGYDLPADISLVEGVEPDSNIKPQWKEYADLLEVSIGAITEAPVDIADQRAMKDVWLQDIWTGKVPVDQISQICQEQADILNAGVEKYKSMNPNFDLSEFVVPDWDTLSER